MRKLFLLLVLMSFASSFILAQPPGSASLTIRWSQTSIDVEEGSSGNQAFVRLDWNDGAAGQNYGVWSWQFEITSSSITINSSSVALHPSISSNFNISKTDITNGVRVAIYGKTPNRMLKDNITSSASYLVLVLTFDAPSSGGTITLTNSSNAVVRSTSSPFTPYTQSVSPATSNLTVNLFTIPTDNVPTFSEPDPPYGSSPRKYGDINWDGLINVADVTGLADVVIGKYSAVTVNDPITGSRDFFGSGGPGFQSGNTADINDRKAADVYGSGGTPDNTLDLMDLATLEDAVTNGAWPSYAISAIANKPAYKINGGPGIGSGILAKIEGGGARFEKVTTDVFVKFEVFNSGQKGSKIRVTVDNNSAELRGLQIELASSVLPGKLDVWSLPDASGLKVAWKRNDFNKIVIIVYADGGKVMKSGSASYVTIVVPNVTREQILGAEPKVIASIKNISYDVNYDVTEASGIVPLNYMLYQNYPNPFNPGTKIEFEVPEYSNVKLIIWNSLGQKVKEIYSGAVDPNRYSVYWDGKDENGLSVASGIYFVTMYARSLEEQGREFTMTRKMILMK
jgi:flagellar hook assembly protein FlgD